MRALLEAHLLECGIELHVLGTRCLAQAIECLAQAVHLPLFFGDGIARWLAHVDLLLEVTIEDGGLHVHVVDLPPLLSHQHEEDTD
jgi:hypothetical protein